MYICTEREEEEKGVEREREDLRSDLRKGNTLGKKCQVFYAVFVINMNNKKQFFFFFQVLNYMFYFLRGMGKRRHADSPFLVTFQRVDYSYKTTINNKFRKK